ncbi:MAG TPA: hypothetical protein VIM77_13285 [Mucilaginibacter sp.]
MVIFMRRKPALIYGTILGAICLLGGIMQNKAETTLVGALMLTYTVGSLIMDKRKKEALKKQAAKSRQGS